LQRKEDAIFAERRKKLIGAQKRRKTEKLIKSTVNMTQISAVAGV